MIADLLSDLSRVAKAARAHPLARKHLSLAASRFLKVQVGSRLARKPLSVRFVNDTRILVGPGQAGANGNHYFGLHEFADMAFLLHYLRASDRFADVGANVGSYSLLASGVVGADTLAFEPVPATVERLERNLLLNGLKKRVDLRRKCAGNREGTVTFTIDADTMNSVVPSTDPRPKLIVSMTTLDREITSPVQLLKVDAEGLDEEVLEGGLRVLSGTEPMAVLIESPGDWGIESGRLNGLGFERVVYDPINRSLAGASNDAPRNNHLFIRDIGFARQRVEQAPKFLVHGFGRL